MNRTSFWTRFDVWYAGLTGFYFLLAFMGLAVKIDCLDACTYPLLPHGAWFANLVGLFVPIGPNNGTFLLFWAGTLTSAFLSPLASVLPGVAIIPLFLAACVVVLWGIAYAVERFLRRFAIAPLFKIVLNLLVLAAITLVVDFALFHSWISFKLLLGSLA